MTESTLVKDEKMEEKIEKRQLIVHQIAFDLKAIKNVVEKDKSGFFAKLGIIKPKQEEIECESLQLFYEPFVVAKANYLLDYYEKKDYKIEVGDETSEVKIFDQILKPEVVKKRTRGILKRTHKEIVLGAQERVLHKATTHTALNRTGREIDPEKLPSASIETEPEKVLKEYGDKTRDLKGSPDRIIDIVRTKTVKRPPDIGKIVKEVFEVTEFTIIYTPVYEARCQHLKTGEIKIIPISGITGKMLSL